MDMTVIFSTLQSTLSTFMFDSRSPKQDLNPVIVIHMFVVLSKLVVTFITPKYKDSDSLTCQKQTRWDGMKLLLVVYDKILFFFVKSLNSAEMLCPCWIQFNS